MSPWMGEESVGFGDVSHVSHVCGRECIKYLSSTFGELFRAVFNSLNMDPSSLLAASLWCNWLPRQPTFISIRIRWKLTATPRVRMWAKTWKLWAENGVQRYLCKPVNMSVHLSLLFSFHPLSWVSLWVNLLRVMGTHLFSAILSEPGDFVR